MARYAVKYTAVLLVLASVFVIAMSKDIISLVYGRAYELAPQFLSLYCMGFHYAGLGSAVYALSYSTVMPLVGGLSAADLENLKLVFGGVRPLKPLVSLVLKYESRLVRCRLLSRARSRSAAAREVESL